MRRDRHETVLRLLEDLVAQAGAYERLLKGNAAAQTAVATLRDMAGQARVELLEALAPEPPRASGLTPREREILALVARGLANKQIAHELAISERTVEFHVSSIFARTGTSSRTEAVVRALAHGWIDAP